MSLPIAWIDRIFEKLTMTYGRDFMDRWRGLSIADVKTDWAHELSGFQSSPESIAFALQNLPAGNPPTVLEFRAIGLKAPRPANKQLEAPKADPARVAAELSKLVNVKKQSVANSHKIDHKAWAKALKARDEAGEKLNPTVRRFYREALRLNLPVIEQ